MRTEALMFWPRRLLQTPDGWGETLIADPRRMEQVVRELREVADTFADIQVDDCQPLDLARALDADTALYHGAWHDDGYHRNLRRYGVAIRRTGPRPDDYERVDFWDTVEGCTEGRRRGRET